MTREYYLASLSLVERERRQVYRTLSQKKGGDGSTRAEKYKEHRKRVELERIEQRRDGRTSLDNLRAACMEPESSSAMAAENLGAIGSNNSLVQRGRRCPRG